MTKKQQPKVFRNPHFKKDDTKTIFAICGISGLSGYGHDTTRSFGWYANEKDAINAVLNNRCDLHEYYYEYAVIEEIKEGVHGLAVTEWWFKWNNKKKNFCSIQKPKVTRGTINWSM